MLHLSCPQDRDGEPSIPGELRAVAGEAAESLAASHLGNIAAVASLAARKVGATPIAQRAWTSWFGNSLDPEAARPDPDEEGQANEAPASTA